MNIQALINLLRDHKKGEIFNTDIDHMLDCYQARPHDLNPYRTNYIFSGIKGSGKTMLLRAYYYQLLAIFLMQCHLQTKNEGLPLLIEFAHTHFSGENAEEKWFNEFKGAIERSVNRMRVCSKDPQLYIKRPLQILRATHPESFLSQIANHFFVGDELVVSEEDLRTSANGGIISGTIDRIAGIMGDILNKCTGIRSLDNEFAALHEWKRPIIFIDEMSGFTPGIFYDEVFRGIFSDLCACSNSRITYTILPFSPADRSTKNATLEIINLSFNSRNNEGYDKARTFLKKILEKLIGEDELLKHMDINDAEADAFEQLVFASNGIPRTCMEILIKALEKQKEELADHNSFTISYEEITEAIKSFGSDIYTTAIIPKKDLLKNANIIIEHCKGQQGFIFTMKELDWDWISVLRFNEENDPAIFIEDNTHPQKYSFHYAICILLSIPTHLGGDCNDLSRKGQWISNIVSVDLS